MVKLNEVDKNMANKSFDSSKGINELLSDLETMDYEDKMLFAFVNKPEKFFWYKKTFAKFSINNVDKVSWAWSWWAFFFGWIFLLYRKSYKYALFIFLIHAVLDSLGSFTNSTGIAQLLFNIACGGLLPYLLFIKFKEDKERIEKVITNEQERIDTMAKIAGKNDWVITAALVLFIFLCAIGFSITFFG